MTSREPERGKLDLEIKLDAISNTNVKEVIENIQSVAEKVLFHWKSFPIHLPTSIVDNKDVCVKNLFSLPTFDELDALTTDCKGNPKFLSHNQLQSIKRKGQFNVPSVNFPSQTHVWKLNTFFQKGIDTAREEYLDGLAFALRFVVVFAPRLLGGDNLSVKDALRSVKSDVVELLDLLLGVGKVYAPNLERRIQEERCKFLVAELKCKGDGAREVGRYVRNQANKAMREKVTMAMERPPPIPYRFTTPVSLDVDLRLFDRDVFRKVGIPMARILEKSGRGWFLSFREKVIAELRTRKMTENEIEMEANIMVMDEYLKRVYNAIRSCDEIQVVGPDIDRLLIEQAHLYILMHRAVDTVSLKMEAVLRDIKKFLVGNYPVLSRDQVWMKNQMEKAQAKFCEENRWLPHEISLELFKQHFLKQHTYFLSRDLAFMRDTEPVLRKELEADKIPCRTFEWKTRIWRPENYVITRCLHGQSETIPTIVSRVSTTITSPRSDPYQPVFSVKRAATRVTTTRWPLWRVSNFLLRTITWMLNVMFFLGYVVPWCSPLSIQALIYKRPFLPDLELSQVNGSLCPKNSSVTLTLISRLIGIWRRVSKARTRFESQPDTGFLGKGCNRLLNRIWNYVFKGGIPSFLLLVFFPLGTIIVCAFSLVLAATTPIWMPLIVLVFHLICVTTYDFDCPVPDRPRVGPLFFTIASLLVQGILQMIFCILGAFIVCPLISTFIIIWTVCNYAVRLGWDSLMFYSLIKPKGRLPSGNSWIVKRIMGPGLAPDFFFEISTEQALIAFQTRLELEELNIFYQKTNQLITQPQAEFRSFFQACFLPFSAKLVETEGRYSDLIRETVAIRSTLEDRVMKRRRELETGLNVQTRSRIRMRKPQLERTLLAACKMSQSFYPDRIFSRMASDDEIRNFWDSRGLDSDDWMNLCILLMSEIFCQDFLTPLEEADVCFNLQTTMKGSPIPTEMFISSIEDEFWSGDVPVTMSKVKYQIHSPFLDTSAFNPMTRSPYIVEDNISINLSIPLPILHPAYISVIIHNRETDNPFTVDNPICQAILKALQDSGPMLNQDCISLDIESSLSSSEDTNARSTPTREDVIGIDSPSPLSLGHPQVQQQHLNLHRNQSHHIPIPIPIPLSNSSADHAVATSPTFHPHQPLSSSSPGRQQSFLHLKCPSRHDSGSSGDLLGHSSSSVSGNNVNGQYGSNNNGTSSKASLASPEDINLEDVVLATYGTSV